MKRFILGEPRFAAKASNQKVSAIIAGAGAVENAWNPILRALKPYHDFPLTPDGANSFLARIVYLLRWYALIPDDESRKELKCHLEFLRSVKDSIIKELRAAERRGEIKARPSLKKLLDTLILPYGPNMMLVTTNWDSVVPKSIAKILRSDFNGWLTPLHLHGNITKLSTMYLPSEVTREPYRKPKDEQAIGSLHSSAIRGLEEVHRVIIYGLSIDPLDAELGQTLAAGWSNPKLEEILIIDPNHEMIALRVNMLLDRKRDVRVIGLNASTLIEEADYTIWRHPNRTL